MNFIFGVLPNPKKAIWLMALTFPKTRHFIDTFMLVAPCLTNKLEEFADLGYHIVIYSKFWPPSIDPTVSSFSLFIVQEYLFYLFQIIRLENFICTPISVECTGFVRSLKTVHSKLNL